MRRGTGGTSTTDGWSASITGYVEHTPLSIFIVKIVGWLTSKDASPRKDWMTLISCCVLSVLAASDPLLVSEAKASRKMI
jgi:hypothetical protein